MDGSTACTEDMEGQVLRQVSQLCTLPHLAMGSSRHPKSLRAPLCQLSLPLPTPLSLDTFSILLLVRLSSPVFFQLQHAEESSGELVKTESWAPHPEILILGSRVELRVCNSNRLPGEVGPKAILCGALDHFCTMALGSLCSHGGSPMAGSCGSQLSCLPHMFLGAQENFWNPCIPQEKQSLHPTRG